MDRYIIGWIVKKTKNGWVDGWKEKLLDRWTDDRMTDDRMKNRLMDRKMGGWWID